ncbi:MAG: carbamoyltransferase HypF [Candidatus Njordarchaeia archaeon]
MKNCAKIIRVVGIVQGVGFRPYIARLADKLGVFGYVKNIGGSEVEIYIEGACQIVEMFIEKMFKEKPPVALIEDFYVEDVVPKNLKCFSIKPSEEKVLEPSMIPPDFGICEHCLHEALDKNSRWYLYPFNSCAWCGPRYSMMYRVPYDRENTSMRDFPLCEDCLNDYRDIHNLRRFHAQGISCPKCGPKIWLTDKDGKTLYGDYPIEKLLKTIGKLLDEGNIIAIKGIGGFHIASLATSDDVVLELRKRKMRPEKPFALMALNLEIVKKFAKLNNLTRRILVSMEKPIVLLPIEDNDFISKYVAPGLHLVGVMLPYTALHYLILRETHDKVLIMTSGNPVGKPMCTTNLCALKNLSNIVDYFIMHNREIVNRVDDSVVRETDGEITFLRRSRGYAPRWLTSPVGIKDTILAFGADLQSAGAVFFKNKIIPTQYIGDVDEFENLEFLSKTFEFFIKTYHLDLKKFVIVSDLHPNYQSTKLALEWGERFGKKVIRVQHHHAHIASVMVEKKIGIDENVIGIAVDGIGLGTDGNIWGGEIILANYENFERLGFLEYQPMPSGDLATIYPIRMLIGALSKKLDWVEIKAILESQDLVKHLKYGLREAEVSFMLAREPNAILTSSMGRILDAVSALLKVCFKRTYEGEPAMKLESLASMWSSPVDIIDLKVMRKDGKSVIQTSDLILGVLEMIYCREKREKIARTVLETLGYFLANIAVEEAERRGLHNIVVSGGAAVNSILIKSIRRYAKENDLTVMLPNKIPAGDGGVSVGQAIIGAFKTRSIVN